MRKYKRIKKKYSKKKKKRLKNSNLINNNKIWKIIYLVLSNIHKYT